MQHPIPFLAAAACIVLAGCDLGETVAPDSRQPDMLIGQSPLEPAPVFLIGDSPLKPDPSFLIGNSALKPLQDPLGFDLWVWTDAKTGDASYQGTVEVLVDASLLESGDARMRLETSAVYRGGRGNDILTSHESAYLTDVDPLAVGTDGYALVVIALPMTKDEASQLQLALSAGPVQVDVKTAVVTTASSGEDEQLDALRTVQVAAPRPSELPIPDKFAR